MKKVRTLLSAGVAAALLLAGCTSYKNQYQREYARVWKEILQSEAWANSMRNRRSADDFLASTDQNITEVAIENTSRFILNDETYTHLVSRAYVKIIAEAEKADKRLKAEYDRWNTVPASNAKLSPELKKEHALINKRYKAHTAMLEGLKSWNIFSEYGTDDLKFFKQENFDQVQLMVQNGQKEEAIVNFLVYQLADLYHFE